MQTSNYFDVFKQPVCARSNKNLKFKLSSVEKFNLATREIFEVSQKNFNFFKMIIFPSKSCFATLVLSLSYYNHSINISLLYMDVVILVFCVILSDLPILKSCSKKFPIVFINFV